MAHATIEKPGITRHGFCRWVSSDPKAAFECGGCAGLIVTTDKGVETHYLVRKTDRGFSLERCDHTGSTYTIDTSFDQWSCDCPDTTYRSGPGGCKHVRALFAALKKIGL